MCLCLGGAFYTPETIDTARLHYRSSWAPVLHAVALWLSSTGFGANEEKEEAPSDPSKAPALPKGASSTTKIFEESVEDRMHLMLGKETHSVVIWRSCYCVFVPYEYLSKNTCTYVICVFFWWYLGIILDRLFPCDCILFALQPSIQLAFADSERVMEDRKKRIACICPKCISVLCLAGVSIEFLCFPRPEEPIEHVISCLQALFTLLESPCAKTHIAQDQVKIQVQKLHM